MCGIVGFVGRKSASPVLLRGLKQLEYRGYDSAGIALLNENKIQLFKRKGRVSELDFAEKFEGNIGIGHTRWATHGAPSESNAHPHLYGKFAVVHNGIIENFDSLKGECVARGECFLSETDSEIIAHLLDRYYEGDLLSALREASKRLEGSYALAVLCVDSPETIAVCREKSPLVVGRGEEGVYVASDIPAVAAECREIYSLADGEFALLSLESIEFFDAKRKIRKERVNFDASGEVLGLSGYSHYMRKEMAEIPSAIGNSIDKMESKLHFSDFCEVLCQTEYKKIKPKSHFSAFSEVLCQTEHIQIIACGTAYHSGIAAKYAIEALARIPVEVTVASEYRYLDPILKKGTLVLAVSQSGETADTIAAAELAKGRGAVLVAITNAPYSSLTRIADFVLETEAGREIAVAATKSFNAQLALLYSLALALARMKGISVDSDSLKSLPKLADEVVSGIEAMKEIAPEFARARSVYFIGRGADYSAALEGSLKLKEISYLPSEGYPAGELKHGTLALVEEDTPVVAILTQEALAEKTMNAVSEVYARGGRVLLVTSLPEFAERKEVARAVIVPKCFELFSPILSVIPLQALAYYTALERGNDPDKPRNLAKSVTVE